MTDQSRLQHALDLAYPPDVDPREEPDTVELAKQLMLRGQAFAIASLLLHVVDEGVGPDPRKPTALEELREMQPKADMRPLDRLQTENSTLRARVEELENEKKYAAERDGATLRRALSNVDAYRVRIQQLVAELDQSRSTISGMKEGLPYRDAELLERGRRERDGEVAELAIELSLERGWDLFRKARMGAVVEAAREVVAYCKAHDYSQPDIGPLESALSALDQQPEPAGDKADHPEPTPPTMQALRAKLEAMQSDKVCGLWENLQNLADAPDEPLPEDKNLIAYVRHPDGSRTPISPKQWAQAVLAHPKPEPASEPRAIVVGSTWRHRIGDKRTVASYEDGYVITEGIDWSYTEDDFRELHRWASDPPSGDGVEAEK